MTLTLLYFLVCAHLHCLVGYRRVCIVYYYNTRYSFVLYDYKQQIDPTHPATQFACGPNRVDAQPDFSLLQDSCQTKLDA